MVSRWKGKFGCVFILSFWANNSENKWLYEIAGDQNIQICHDCGQINYKKLGTIFWKIYRNCFICKSRFLMVFGELQNKNIF